MIELIGTPEYQTVSQPCLEVVSLLTSLRKNTREKLAVAEIGVGIGATTCEILKKLSPGDVLHFFDFQQTVNALLTDFAKADLGKGVELSGFGNTRKTYDSYVWSLAKIAMTRNKQNTQPEVYDLVYLDGAHSFFHDYPAAILLKSMIKPNGYLIFDDMYWRYATSPTVNPVKKPEILNLYTEEQINTAQVEMVVELAMKGDPGFTCVSSARAPRAVFQKKEKKSYK